MSCIKNVVRFENGILGVENTCYKNTCVITSHSHILSYVLKVRNYGSRQVHFFGSPTASDFNLRQHRTSDSVGLQPPTASDLNLQQHRTSDSVGLHLRQRRTSISDSGGLLSPTAADFYLRQRRTSSPTASDRTTISDSVGLQSPTAS